MKKVCPACKRKYEEEEEAKCPYPHCPRCGKTLRDEEFFDWHSGPLNITLFIVGGVFVFLWIMAIVGYIGAGDEYSKYYDAYEHYEVERPTTLGDILNTPIIKKQEKPPREYYLKKAKEAKGVMDASAKYFFYCLGIWVPSFFLSFIIKTCPDCKKIFIKYVTDIPLKISKEIEEEKWEEI
jgi:NAD-dependent SIR2 family protein deacetylase